MIKKLQRKYLLITMCSAFTILLLITSLLNIAYYVQSALTNNELLNTLAENNGYFPEELGIRVNDESVINSPGISKETPFKTRYFFVQADNAGNILHIHLDNIASVTTQSAISMTYSAIRSGKDSGTNGIYRYIISQKYYGNMVIFLDCRETNQIQSFLLWASGVFAVMVLIMLFIPVYFLTRRATKPVAQSVERQKQFITDAGHEIKTPLAIISANTDVLQMCGEDNEWLQSIKNQTKRLDKLVKNLVTLSKMDEQRTTEFTQFNISEAVLDTASQFEALAFAQNKAFNLNIDPNLTYNGDENEIRQLVSILCDNAVKYSEDGGSIAVKLCKKGKQTVLSVTNTCENIDRTKLDRLFDRFYRTDESRSSKTGGFGIGLSIARATVLRHKGKISAESADGHSIVFTAVL